MCDRRESCSKSADQLFKGIRSGGVRELHLRSGLVFCQQKDTEVRAIQTTGLWNSSRAERDEQNVQVSRRGMGKSLGANLNDNVLFQGIQMEQRSVETVEHRSCGEKG